MRPTLHEAAETAWAYVDGPETVFHRQPQLVLRHVPTAHPMFGMAVRPRLEDVEGAVAHARAWFGAQGRGAFTWLVGGDARPRDLADRLIDLGARPDAADPLYAGMVLEHDTEPVAGVSVRRVSTFEDYVAAVRVTQGSFELPSNRRNAELRQRFEARRNSALETFVAVVDGEVVGSGTSAYLPCGAFLLGGNVAPHARGRGVYRTLVHARRLAAAERGAPGLVTQAGRMSRPILERLGFETVCELQALVDTAGEPSAARPR